MDKHGKYSYTFSQIFPILPRAPIGKSTTACDLALRLTLVGLPISQPGPVVMDAHVMLFARESNLLARPALPVLQSRSDARRSRGRRRCSQTARPEYGRRRTSRKSLARYPAH